MKEEQGNSRNEKIEMRGKEGKANDRANNVARTAVEIASTWNFFRPCYPSSVSFYDVFYFSFFFLQSFFAFFLARAYCLLGIVLDGWSRNSPIELKILYEPRDAPFHCRRIIGFSGIRREFETNSDVNDRCKLSSNSSDGPALFTSRYQ